MKAMVLAAGLGTRLRPATDAVPKPLFPVLGVPAVEWALHGLREAGVTAAVLNLHHLSAAVVRRLGSGRGIGVKLEYSDEPVILGTGGGLSAVRDFFDGEDAFLLHNGDVFTDWDLGAVVARHREAGAAATMALADPADMPQARLVEAGPDGDVVGIRGRPRAGDGPRYVFSGVSVLTPALLERLPRGAVSCLVEDGLIPLMADGGRVAAATPGGLFCDIGTAERFLALQWEVFPEAARLFQMRGLPAPREAGPGVLALGEVHVAAGAVLEGPVVLGAGARVEAGARVGPRAVLCEDAVARPGAVVRDAVVFPGVVAEGPLGGIAL
jgi:NDP-sugar pyrophosphorylase family protein